jgi:hypothetical protein
MRASEWVERAEVQNCARGKYGLGGREGNGEGRTLDSLCRAAIMAGVMRVKEMVS